MLECLAILIKIMREIKLLKIKVGKVTQTIERRINYLDKIFHLSRKLWYA